MLVAYKCINTADSMIGYRTPRHQAFGWAAARTDDLVNLIPARRTALFISAAHARFDIRALRRDAGLHRSPMQVGPKRPWRVVLGSPLLVRGPTTVTCMYFLGSMVMPASSSAL